MSRKYTEKDIQTLEGLEHIRQCPSMYIGDTSIGGVLQLFIEIVSNSIDEILQDNVNNTKIAITTDGFKITIRDYGRGIPLGKLHEACSVPNTGGKFESNGAYSGIQTGLHGLGLKVVNALSEEFSITSYYGGKKQVQTFSMGERTYCSRRNKTSEPSGVEVTFVPDSSIFNVEEWPESKLFSVCNDYCYILPKLKIELNGELISHPEGLVGKLRTLTSKEFLYEPILIQEKGLQILFAHVDDFAEKIVSYANMVRTTDGGTHVTTLKTALTQAVNQLADSKFTGKDVRSGIVCVMAVFVQDAEFEGQTKRKLNTDMSGMVKEWRESILRTLVSNNTAKDCIVQSATMSQELKKRSKLVKDKIRKANHSVAYKSKLLKDCITTDVAKREIFIVEGNSASGTIVAARDKNTQAVYPLRGKLKNVINSSQETLWKNETLFGLVHSLGIAEEVDQLRYSKIILTTDADEDGYHIQNLLLVFFYHYFPDIIEAGHLYILNTPLFRCQSKKGGVRYCYTTAELEDALKETDYVIITRHKGLGEVNSSDMASFIHPSTRSLINVTIESWEGLERRMDFFCNPRKAKARKGYLLEKFEETRGVGKSG